MKKTTLVAGLFFGSMVQGCVGITSLTAPMVAPEGRTNRSTFDMYRSEEGEPMFRFNVSHFSALSTEKQRNEAQQWLLEWLKENQYCKNGYEIVSNSYQPWPHALLDPVPIGGMVVAVGKCKLLNKPA